MQITLLTFAQSADQLGFRERLIDVDATESPRDILRRIAPAFDPTGLRVAVDHEYHDWDEAIGPGRELALIPPVSGG